MSIDTKPMLLLFNEMVKNGNHPNEDNLADCYLYMASAAADGSDLLRKFVPNGETDGAEFRRFLISSIIGFMINTDDYSPFIHQLRAMAESVSMSDAILMAFCAGVGAAAKEEIR